MREFEIDINGRKADRPVVMNFRGDDGCVFRFELTPLEAREAAAELIEAAARYEALKFAPRDQPKP